MARSANRATFHAYANEHVIPRMFSTVYDFPTLATVLMKKGGTTGRIGRPGSSVMIGRKLPPAQAETLRGSTQAQIFYQGTTLGGNKWVGADDTGASAGAERTTAKKLSCYVSWAENAQAVAIPNQQLDANQSKYKVGSILEDAVDMAMESQLSVFGTSLYTGNPSDQTEEIVDSVIGLDQWIHDTNTIGGVDRSQAANANFRGRRSTATLNLSLKLIDDICIEGVDDGNAGTTTSLLARGSKADVVIVPLAGYNKLKQEAISRQLGRVVQESSQPSGGQVGFKGEYIDYNGKMIVPDPYAAASSLYVLDSSTWMLQFFGGKNFALMPFKNLREQSPGTGAPDLTTSEMVTKCRLLCFKPGLNFHGTAVS